MFERILVPLDGSERGERMLPLALHVARWFDAELTLFHVLSRVRPVASGSAPGTAARQPPGDIRYPDELHDRGLSLGGAYLDEVARRVRDRGGRVRTGIVAGKPAEMIAARAVAGGFGLIAMTTTARPPALRFFRRGTLRAVWPVAPVPLLVLGDGFVLEEDVRALSPDGLLVLLDGSRRAEWGLLYARVLARAGKLPVTLLRSVLRPPLAPVDDAVRPTGCRDVEQYLDERAEALRSHGVEAVSELTYRDPAYAVAEAQRADPGRMVVVASRMRRGLRRAILGSWADEVVRHSRGAVMVVPTGRARRGSGLPDAETDEPLRFASDAHGPPEPG